MNHFQVFFTTTKMKKGYAEFVSVKPFLSVTWCQVTGFISIGSLYSICIL